MSSIIISEHKTGLKSMIQTSTLRKNKEQRAEINEIENEQKKKNQ